MCLSIVVPADEHRTLSSLSQVAVLFPDLLRLDLHVYMQVVRNDVRRQATFIETILFCGVLIYFDTCVSVFVDPFASDQ